MYRINGLCVVSCDAHAPMLCNPSSQPGDLKCACPTSKIREAKERFLHIYMAGPMRKRDEPVACNLPGVAGRRGASIGLVWRPRETNQPASNQSKLPTASKETFNSHFRGGHTTGRTRAVSYVHVVHSRQFQTGRSILLFCHRHGSSLSMLPSPSTNQQRSGRGYFVYICISSVPK